MSHTILVCSSDNLQIEILSVCLSVCLFYPQGQRTFSFHGRQRQWNPSQCYLSNVGLRWWGFWWNLWWCQGLYQQSTKERYEVKLLDLIQFLCLHLAQLVILISPLWISTSTQAPLAILSKSLCAALVYFTCRVQGLNGALPFNPQLILLFPSLGQDAPWGFPWLLLSSLLCDTDSCTTCSLLIWMGCNFARFSSMCCF